MAVVTQIAQVFTEAKTLDSRVLNLVGAHPLRAVLARLFYKLRPGSRDRLIAELTRTGIIVCEDFLPAAAFAALEREAEDYMSSTVPTWVDPDGTTESHRYSLAKVDPERFPHLVQWRVGPQVMALASAAERRDCRRRGDGGALTERLVLGDYSEPDSQTELHIDTFFNTHKMWLYLDDVSVNNAALVYVPGSHRLDRVRLRYEYLESTSRNQPSRRVSEDEVRSRGLERRVVTCPRNTLVIVNTCGYHCRSVGEAGAIRRALHKSFRFNPFTPETWSPSRLKRSVARATKRIALR
jgi:hypothetical protein